MEKAVKITEKELKQLICEVSADVASKIWDGDIENILIQGVVTAMVGKEVCNKLFRNEEN